VRGLDQLRRVVAHPVLEHQRDVLDVADVLRRIALDQYQVGRLAHVDRTDLLVGAHEARAVQGGDPDRLHRRKAGFHQQLHFALVAVAGDHAAIAGRVETGQQGATALTKARSKAISSWNAFGHGESFIVATCSRVFRYSARVCVSMASSTRASCGARPGTKVSNTGSVDVTATCFASRCLISPRISGPSTFSVA